MEMPPFTVIGVDFTMALYVKEREVFSSPVTRAAHLEVVAEN